MNIDEIIHELRKRGGKLDLLAAQRLERMRDSLRTFALCDLNDDNCASLAVASKRIRNLANRALREDEK